MAKSFDLTIDLSDVRAKLARFVEDNPKAAAALLKDQVRLLMGTLIKWTPPENQKQGRATINADLGNLVAYAFADHAGLMAIYRAASKSRDANAHIPWRGPLMGLQRDDHQNMMFPISRLDTTGELLKADHARSRNKRGRVIKNKYWITSRRVAAKVLRELYTHVGNLKKGWQAAAASVGAAMPNFALKSVGGPSGLASGYVENGIGESWMPFITVANTTPYIRDDSGFVDRAMKVRQLDLETKLPGQIRRIIKSAGLD